jgi:hypothetical protein
VVVSVFKILEVVGGARLGGDTEDDSVITVSDVLVNTVVDSPGFMLVIVIMLAVEIVRLFDTDGDIELGELMDGDGSMTVEVLVHVVVCPPSIVLVSVLREVDVIGGGSTVVEVDGSSPMTIVVVIVKVVITPPGAVLVTVIVMLEVIGEEELDRALVRNVDCLAEVNDGADMITLLVKLDMLVG